jgi:transketolase
MGISYAVGVAMAKKQDDGKVYVVLGDGELNEGNVWEAAPLASKLKLGNLIAVVDKNGLQSDGQCQDIMGQNLEELWRANGWQVLICDGHSIDELSKALDKCDNERPTVILAQTVKGKGISFMENDNSWHHSTLSEAQYNDALTEIGEHYGFSKK